MNDKKIKSKKKCTKCGRELPLDKFQRGKSWCKSCCSAYLSERNGKFPKESNVKIERIYKEIFPTRKLDMSEIGIKLMKPDEYFVKLINYKNAWISNYGRVLEKRQGKYRLKRTKKNEFGEKICTLEKNVYNEKKWVYQKQKVEVWKLVVGEFIVNFDMVGNSRCWHIDNNKSNNYYKNIYPVGEKQYAEIMNRLSAGERISEEVIFDIVNITKYKEDDWFANKWKRTVKGVGYLGCNRPRENENEIIYAKWSNMMHRCYDENVHKLKPYYASCTVAIEWHNFSNFREWYKENSMGNKKLDLDKDILVQGNTVYSPETVTLIQHFANTIFEERGLETNIILNEVTGKYEVTMSVLGKREEVGSFDTEEEARQGFVDYKQEYIRDFASKCVGLIPNKTYEAMMNWNVQTAANR